MATGSHLYKSNDPSSPTNTKRSSSMFRVFAWIVGLASGVALVSALFADDAAEDLRGDGIVADKNLAGTWNLVESINQGQETPEEEIAGSRVIVRENNIQVLDPNDDELYRCVFTFDRSEDPATITMRSTTPGRPATLSLGIYKVDDQTWTLCYAMPGFDRPEKFESSDDEQTLLMVMKRPEGLASDDQ